MKKLKIIAIVFVALIVLLALLPLFAGVDRFRPQLESELSSALGRSVRIESLSLSLLSRSVSVENFSVGEDPAFGSGSFVRARALTVGVEVWPLIASRAVKVTEISLDGPEISLIQGEGGVWSFSSLSKGGAPSSPSAPDLSVAKLEIYDGRVTIASRGSSRAPHVYDEINISVHDFSMTTPFTFELDGNLPGGGTVTLAGEAGPISAENAASTPLSAELEIEKLSLSVLSVAAAADAIGGSLSFSGSVRSDGASLTTEGKAVVEGLKLVASGKPAGAPVSLEYSAIYDLKKQSGALKKCDASAGKALVQLTGTYQTRAESQILNLKLSADKMPVDDLEPLLPGLGVVLPDGASLEGGTFTVKFTAAGPVEKLVVAGPIRLADTKIMGFDLGSKLSAISALANVRTGPNTTLRTLAADARVGPEGTRVNKLELIIDGMGSVSGAGTISPGGALNFRMRANPAGDGGVTQIIGGGRNGIPFFIQGTASSPTFLPDVAGIVGNTVGNVVESALGGILGGGR